MQKKNKNLLFRDLLQRVITHSLLLTFLVILFFTSLSPALSLALGVSLSCISGAATFELATMAKSKFGFHFITSTTLGAFIFLLLSFIQIRWKLYIPDYFSLIPWSFLVILLIHISFKSSRLKKSSAIMEISLSLFSILYSALPFRLFLNILYGFIKSDVPILGIWWACFLIATTKGSDIFGYFFGQSFGRKKIAPVISPNKTFVGFIASCIGAILISILFYFQIPTHFSPYIKYPLVLMPLGLLFAIIGFLGDLLESIFKRDAGFKNSSKLKGVGGVLDIIDSLILTTPILYAFLRITLGSSFLK